jgi:hypothetical protein
MQSHGPGRERSFDFPARALLGPNPPLGIIDLCRRPVTARSVLPFSVAVEGGCEASEIPRGPICARRARHRFLSELLGRELCPLLGTLGKVLLVPRDPQHCVRVFQVRRLD